MILDMLINCVIVFKGVHDAMIGKRGEEGNFLSQNFVSLVIAVIGLVLVFFAASRLYAAYVNNEAENAKNFLNVIEAKIGNLKDGEVGRYSIRAVKNWYLLGWNKNEGGRPDKCFFESCVCICPKDYKNPAGSCDKAGFCRDLKEFDSIRVLNFNKVKNKQTIVNEEDIIKDVNNYFGKYGEWVTGIQPYPLLDECPLFSEENLVEMLIYKKGKSLAILKMNELDFSRFEAKCQR